MQHQNVVITGGTDGIGKAAAIDLAKLGPRLLLVSRNPQKGEAAVTEVERVSGNDAVSYLRADLSLVKNVRRAAEQIRQTFDKLDVLVHSGLIIENPAMRLLMNTAGRLFSRSPERAADDMVALLTTAQPSGFYGASARRNDVPESADPASSKRMWEYGQRWVAALSV